MNAPVSQYERRAKRGPKRSYKYDADQAVADLDTVNNALLRNDETLRSAAHRALRRAGVFVPAPGSMLAKRVAIAKVILGPGEEDEWRRIKQAAAMWRELGG